MTSRIRDRARRLRPQPEPSPELRERIEELEARLDHERLYPLEWANRRIRDRLGDEIQAGPFKGFTYPDWAMTRVDLFSPKLLGTFERELHPALERMFALEPPRVVNIGAAEGYYAVGAARRLPGAQVVAYEDREDLHWDLRTIAELNGVQDRIELLGHADLAALRESVQPGTLVLCDCEGGEKELLDPDAVPALRSCAMLVEAHDLIVPGVTETLERAFAATHEIETISTQPRYVDGDPELSWLPLVTAQLAISEFRQGPMAWLAMTPRR